MILNVQFAVAKCVAASYESLLSRKLGASLRIPTQQLRITLDNCMRMTANRSQAQNRRRRK